MRLAPRLVLTFGLLTTLSTAGVGIAIRESWRGRETARFQSEVAGACERVTGEVARQAEVDRRLVVGACRSGELVDRVLVTVEAGELDDRQLGFAALVPQQREAFTLDSLALVTGDGAVIGADPKALLSTPRAALRSQLAAPSDAWTLEGDSIVVRCARRGRDQLAVGLVGSRRLTPLFRRIASTLAVAIDPPGAPPPRGEVRTRCTLLDPRGTAATFTVAQATASLESTLAEVDRTLLFAVAAAAGASLVLSVLLARSLGRPIARLAEEAGKVASGAARPLEAGGSGEVRELAVAFARMLDDLARTRERLAATSRIAAWREVARRVAHEVKNPLAPIRAAVETLRRLRARDDPAFDEYFDEASRTVLDEVHRISNIVTEFTRFARLPAPRPAPVDLTELVASLVALHAESAPGVSVRSVVLRRPPEVRADRDQIVQVLTNLVQNAQDATRGAGGSVTVTLDAPDASRAHVTVVDDGPGVAPEVAGRLFEPYATTKAQGTGLGLAIAQRIAIEHGGELTYVGPSASGRGAAFRLVLPVEGPAELTPPSLAPDA